MTINIPRPPAKTPEEALAYQTIDDLRKQDKETSRACAILCIMSFLIGVMITYVACTWHS